MIVRKFSAGIGYGMTSCAGILITGHYFEKYRALANGITMCGSGAGAVLIGQLVMFLLKEFEDDWRRILKILGGLFLLLFFLTATFKPLKETKVRVVEKKITFKESESDTSQITINITNAKIHRMSNLLSMYTLSDTQSFESKLISTCEHYI